MSLVFPYVTHVGPNLYCNIFSREIRASFCHIVLKWFIFLITRNDDLMFDDNFIYDTFKIVRKNQIFFRVIGQFSENHKIFFTFFASSILEGILKRSIFKMELFSNKLSLNFFMTLNRITKILMNFHGAFESDIIFIYFLPG